MHKKYKDTFVSRNSALHVATSEGKEAEAKKIYDETTAAFFALYGNEDAAWFIRKHKENV